MSSRHALSAALAAMLLGAPASAQEFCAEGVTADARGEVDEMRPNPDAGPDAWSVFPTIETRFSLFRLFTDQGDCVIDQIDLAQRPSEDCVAGVDFFASGQVRQNALGAVALQADAIECE